MTILNNLFAIICAILKLSPRFKQSVSVKLNMSAAFYTRRRQCFTVAAEKFDTCGGGI